MRHDRPTLQRDMTIGQIIEIVPGSERVIRKYFFGGCHHCPSQHTEPLWLAARLYGYDVEEILFDLRHLQLDPEAVLTDDPQLTARERRLERERKRDEEERRNRGR